MNDYILWAFIIVCGLSWGVFILFLALALSKAAKRADEEDFRAFFDYSEKETLTSGSAVLQDK